MNKFLLIALLAVAMFLAACGEQAANKPANAANGNANAAKPAAAAPTKEALLDMEKKANEAYFKGETKLFEEMLSDKFVSYYMGKRGDKAEELKMIAAAKCDVKSWSLDDPQMSMIDADTYVMSYKGTYDGTCVWEGKSQKIPSPMRAATVWVRSGDSWKGAFHAETPIVDPKAAPPAPETAKKEEPKKEEAKKSDTAAKDDAAAPANTATAAAKPAAGPNTDALVKIHQSGWEAFRTRDAKKLSDISTASLSIVDPLGNWHSGRDNVVKLWTETMKCEGITKTSITDGVATAISPTVEILTLKGTADGTCDGQKNGDLYQTAVYVKEGDAWKLAFMFESPAM